MVRLPRNAAVLIALAGLLAGCAAGPNPPVPSATPSAAATQAAPSPTAEPAPGPGSVTPAPGSASAAYAPNPAAIVVAIEAGHGGCLDWGVPNPFDNTVHNAEKTMTLAIARELRGLLEADGLTVLMIRDDDVALAGDYYPDLGCEGEPWRDVNEDGHVGFGSSVPQATRTRDEQLARIDKANLARADLFISIHINSMTQNDVVYEIAATETYYDERNEWSDESQRLAEHVQAAVVAQLGAVVDYDRQDRGVKVGAYYILAPPPSEEGGLGPPRGIQMPGVLAEVGSMSLEAEGQLLTMPTGQRAVAEGLATAVTEFLADRPLAVRYDADVPGGTAGEEPAIMPGDGPLFWAPATNPQAPLTVTLTNTGTRAWPANLELLVGWEATERPYLAAPPATLQAHEAAIPPLAAGESVKLEIELPEAPGPGRHVVWVTLAAGETLLSSLGSPALQLALQAD